MALELKEKAKESGKSLSTYVVELIQPKLEKKKFDWDEFYARLDSFGPCEISLTEEDRYHGVDRDINLD